jgi:acyl-CoA synthetase (AMP-forming)/AMP-acid ligase II
MLSAMLAGLNVWPITRTEPRAVMDLIERERITIFFAFPDVYCRMYLEGFEHYDFSSMRTWVGTADTSHSIHKKAFTQKGAFLRFFGKPLLRSIFVDAFGSSEICFAALTRITFSFSKPRLDRLLGTTNPAGPRVRIADEDGRTIPRGQIGRVMVKGPTLFKGYWNSHDRLHGTMHDGWWWTGDIGYRDRLGRFYHLDRATDVIQTAQGAVYSLLAEEVLINHPEVSEVSVFGVPAAGGQQAAIAVVNARSGCAPNPLTLRLWTNERLKLSAPIADVFVVQPDEVPRGLTGKVLKRVLREQYAAQAAQPSTNGDSAPATSTPIRRVLVAMG